MAETEQVVDERSGAKQLCRELGLPEIFADFCATERSRYSIDQPFRDGEYLCATDGKRCIRIHRPGSGPPIPEGMTTPPVSSLGWEKCVDGTAFLLPDVPEPVAAQCSECHGKKRTRCPECNGHGDSTCPECGSFVECDECEGGAVECGTCGGTGQEINEVVSAVRFGHQWMRTDLLRTLKKHGIDRVFVPPPPTPPARPVRPFWFTTSYGAEGMVMSFDFDRQKAGHADAKDLEAIAIQE